MHYWDLTEPTDQRQWQLFQHIEIYGLPITSRNHILPDGDKTLTLFLGSLDAVNITLDKHSTTA